MGGESHLSARAKWHYLPTSDSFTLELGPLTGERSERAMFIYYFTYARAPMAQVATLLSGSTDEWVTDIFHQALEEDDLVKVRLVAGLRVPVAKEAWFQVGKPQEVGAELLIPIRVESTTVPELFPSLDGEIELAAVGNELTQITLKGTYRPPLGAFGRVANRFLLHRLAEASIKHFLDDLAASIEDALETRSEQTNTLSANGPRV